RPAWRGWPAYWNICSSICCRHRCRMPPANHHHRLVAIGGDMDPLQPEFTIGVEEEYLLVDRETRALVVEPPQCLIEDCEAHIGGQVTSELLRSQIESGTRACDNMQELRADLARLRQGIIDVVGRHGLAPIAASTHPFSRWSEQKQTRHERYDSLTEEMQVAARRL